jgi:single-strand DNA-binding protein
LKTRSWEDKEGVKKFMTEVVGDNLIMLDKRTDGTAKTDVHDATTGSTYPDELPPIGEPTGDLPF